MGGYGNKFGHSLGLRFDLIEEMSILPDLSDWEMFSFELRRAAFESTKTGLPVGAAGVVVDVAAVAMNPSSFAFCDVLLLVVTLLLLLLLLLISVCPELHSHLSCYRMVCQI